MGFCICKIEEIVSKLKRCWPANLVAALLFVAGLVVGLIVSSKSCTCWWCQGRLACIKIVMFKGFFAVFFRFLTNFSLLFLLLCLLSATAFTNYLKLAICFVVGLFVATYAKLLVGWYAFCGLLCALLIFVVLGVLCWIGVILSFDAFGLQGKSYNLSDVVRANFIALTIFVAAIVYVMVVTFLVVRLFVVVQ